MNIPSPKQEHEFTENPNPTNGTEYHPQDFVNALDKPPPPPPPEAAIPSRSTVYAVQSSNSSVDSYCSSSSSSSSSSDESSGAFPIYVNSTRSRASSSDSSGAFPSAMDNDDDEDEEDLLPIASRGVMLMRHQASPSASAGASPLSHGRGSEGKAQSPSVPSYNTQGRQINASPSVSPVPSPASSVKKVLIKKRSARPDGGVGRTISADSSDDDIEEDRKSEQRRRQREAEQMSRLVVMAKQQQSFATAWFAASSNGIEIVGPDGRSFQGTGRKSRSDRSVGSRSSASSSRSPSPARSDVSNSSTISTKSEGPIDVDSGELWDTDEDGDDESSTSSRKSLRRALSDILGRGGAKVKNKEENQDRDIGGTFAAASVSSHKSTQSSLSGSMKSCDLSNRERAVRKAVPVAKDVEKGVPPIGLIDDDDSLCTDNPLKKRKWIDRTVQVGRFKCSTFTLLLVALATVIVVGVSAVVAIALSDNDSDSDVGNEVVSESLAETSADGNDPSPSPQPTPIDEIVLISQPSVGPTVFPSVAPSGIPSVVPTIMSSAVPTSTPSLSPSWNPSLSPSGSPSTSPSESPSMTPSSKPSMSPTTLAPSTIPTSLPSIFPSSSPSVTPTAQPSSAPSNSPSFAPSSVPTTSTAPSLSPSSSPTSFYRSQSFTNIGQINSTSENAGDGALADQTGKAVAISKDGTVMAVSGDWAEGRQGRVRVFKAVTSRRNLRQKSGENNFRRNLESDVTWELMGEILRGRKNTDHFGAAVRLSDDGNRLAVSEPGFDNQGKFNSGNVRVFDFNGTNWNLVGNEIGGEVEADLFGSALAMSGDGRRVAIGSYMHDTDNHPKAGWVRLYELNGNVWSDMGSPLNGTGFFEQFGRSISMNEDGSVVAVGAPRSSEGGYVQAFSWVDATGEWEIRGPRMYNEATNAQRADYFGFSVSLSADGSRCAVGAPYYAGAGTPNGGVALVFEYVSPSDTSDASWDQIGEDLLGDGSVTRQLGYSISLSPDGEYVAVGASGDEETLGRVFVHRWTGYLWDYSQPIISNELNDDFGHAVSLSLNGTRLAVGAPVTGKGAGHGSASIFEL